MDPADATLTFFRDLVGQTFTVAADGDTIALQLVAAEPLRSGPQGIDRARSFTLEFAGPDLPELTQGTFPLRHEALGEMPTFLVPVERIDGGLRYEAVFNRLA